MDDCDRAPDPENSHYLLTPRPDARSSLSQDLKRVYCNKHGGVLSGYVKDATFLPRVSPKHRAEKLGARGRDRTGLRRYFYRGVAGKSGWGTR